MAYGGRICIPTPQSALTGAGEICPPAARAHLTPARGRRAGGRTPAAGAARSGCVASVCEGRGNQVGLAIAAIDNPTDVTILQVADVKSFAKTLATLHRFAPRDVLVADNYARSFLSQRLAELGYQGDGDDADGDAMGAGEGESGWRVVHVARRFFNDTAGHEFVVQHSSRAVMTQAQAAQAYLALASLAALTKYLEHIQSVYFAPRGVNIRLQSLAGHMFIDTTTVKHLELVRNRRTGGEAGTLLAVLDRCRTGVGRRLLRSSLLAPFTDAGEIGRRQEAVAELAAEGEAAAAAEEALRAITHWDFVVNQVAAVPKTATPRTCATMARAMCALRGNLLTCAALGRRLRAVCAAPALVEASGQLDSEGGRSIADALGELVDDEAEAKRRAAALPAHGVFAVRAGVDPLLDVARRALLEAHADMEALCASYAEEHAPLGPALKWSAARGFHLALSEPAEGQLPGLFLQPVRQKRRILCSTAALQSLSASFKEALAQVHQLTAQALGRARDEVLPWLPALYDAVDATALVDVLRSLAEVAGGKGYVRPVLHRGGLALATQAARHPLVEQACAARGREFVANDLYLSSAANVRVVTGPNAAGKSTFLKQTALLAVMAQAGSHVPAAFASTRVFDRVCCRVGTEDELASNASTFSVEMAETAAILRELTPASLVILDELGRGTSHAEGFAIAWAAVEVLKSSQAFALLATHFHGLARLAEAYPNVDLLHLAATPAAAECSGGGDGGERGGGEVDGAPSYRVCEGAAPPVPMHGVRLAAQCGMPRDVVELAAALRAEVAARLHPPSVTWANSAEVEAVMRAYGVAKQVLPLAGASVDAQGRRMFLERVRRRVEDGGHRG